MKPAWTFLLASLTLAIVVVGIGLFAGQAQGQQYYGPGGGAITGYILGFTIPNQFEPIDWAVVYATNGNQTFQAFSGMSGVYEMHVPVGKYEVTASVSGFQSLGQNVTVYNGSVSVLNFYLEQPHIAVPEFGTHAELIAITTTLAVAFVLKKRSLARPTKSR